MRSTLDKESAINRVKELSTEVEDMRKELNELKEVLRGLIEVVMRKEGALDDEYN